MRRKINVLVVTLMLCLTSMVIIKFDNKVKADEEQIQTSGIDLQFVKNITTNLSEIIYHYPNGMLPQGRAFGSWGELNASTYIYNIMQGLNLNPTKERITQYPNMGDRLRSIFIL